MDLHRYIGDPTALLFQEMKKIVIFKVEVMVLLVVTQNVLTSTSIKLMSP